MEFYKIQRPKLADFITASDNLQYFTFEQLQTKRKQLKVLYPKHYISYLNVTNTGGYPIIHDGEDICSLLQEFYGDDWDSFTMEDIDSEIELLGYHTQPL